MSMRTIYRRIRSYGLASYRPIVRLLLTSELEWCRLREHWVDEWHQIIFSDESRFCLWQSDGRLRVRRPSHSGLTPGVMVWGTIQFGSRSPLVFIQGSRNAARYINEVLEPVLLPYLQRHRNSVFQQDNARPHFARVTQRVFNDNNVNLLPWPAKSPDLSPIEHVWNKIGRRVEDFRAPIGTWLNFEFLG
jgi:hypothetical protein